LTTTNLRFAHTKEHKGLCFLILSLLPAPFRPACGLVVKFSVSFVIAHISNFSLISLLAVCCASRIKPPKIACKGIFYSANCQANPRFASSPINRGLYGFFQRKNRKNLQVQQAASDHKYWTCSRTRLVLSQVLQNAPHFAVFKRLLYGN
jgi:hypothetical protein